VTPYFGTKIDRWEGSVRLDPDVMEDVGAEWGDKGNGVGFEIRDTREYAKEIALYKFFGGDPKLLTMVVDDLVLMGMLVNGEGAGRGMEEIGEEIGYRYL